MTWLSSSRVGGGQLEVEPRLKPKCLCLDCALPIAPHSSLISGWTQDVRPLPTRMSQTSSCSHTVIFFSSSTSSTSWLFWRLRAFSTSGAAEGKAAG